MKTAFAGQANCRKSQIAAQLPTATSENPLRSELGVTAGMPLFLQRSSLPQTDTLLQAKLTVNKLWDAHEQEADRVADQVMRIPDPASLVQQKPLSDEEEAVQTKPIAISSVNGDRPQQKYSECEQERQVQRLGKGTAEAGSDIESRLNNSKGGGSPLSDEVRSFMEPRFSVDFSQVRVHTGSEAVQMNRALNAQAFTHRQDVYFGTGKVPAKDALTAHELAHVVQQTGAVQRIPEIQREDLAQDLNQHGKPNDLYNQEDNRYITTQSGGTLDFVKLQTMIQRQDMPERNSRGISYSDSSKDDQLESKYYSSVAPTIIGAAYRRGVALQQALFMIAQARAEQGRQEPVKNRYRIFNLQVPLKEAKDAGSINKTRDGKEFAWIKSREVKPNGEEWFPLSPFYVYGSLEESVNHYLDAVLTGRYSGGGARKILLAETQGGIREFGRALQSVGYATEPNYIDRLEKNYRLVAGNFKKILIKAKSKAEATLKNMQQTLQEAEKDLSSWGEKLEFEKQKSSEESDEVKVARVFVQHYEQRVSQLQQDILKLQQDIESYQSELSQIDSAIKKLK